MSWRAKHKRGLTNEWAKMNTERAGWANGASQVVVETKHELATTWPAKWVLTERCGVRAENAGDYPARSIRVGNRRRERNTHGKSGGGNRKWAWRCERSERRRQSGPKYEGRLPTERAGASTAIKRRCRTQRAMRYECSERRRLSMRRMSETATYWAEWILQSDIFRKELRWRSGMVHLQKVWHPDQPERPAGEQNNQWRLPPSK